MFHASSRLAARSLLLSVGCFQDPGSGEESSAGDELKGREWCITSNELQVVGYDSRFQTVSYPVLGGDGGPLKICDCLNLDDIGEDDNEARDRILRRKGEKECKDRANDVIQSLAGEGFSVNENVDGHGDNCCNENQWTPKETVGPAGKCELPDTDGTTPKLVCPNRV